MQNSPDDSTPQFNIVPEEQELAAIERDLTFHPSPVSQPSTLSRQQFDAYHELGFVRPVRIFKASEIDDIRDYFDGLLAEVMAAGGDSYSISSAHLKHGRVYDLLTDARIVGCVRDLLGPDVIGWGSHFFCKMPHDGKAVTWHQDASYWPLTPSKTVTVWLAVDDADRDNACVQFVSSSHLHGHLHYRDSETAESNVLTQTIEDVEQYGPVVENVLEAGEISMHSDLLVHGSEANNSDRRRCGLTLRYTTPDVRAHLGWNAKGVLVSGTAPDDHWACAGRPQGD